MRAFVEEVSGYVNLIEGSDLDWTVVRVPMLTDEPPQGKFKIGYLDANTGKNISRAAVAGYILDVLMNEKYIRQMPLISY